MNRIDELIKKLCPNGVKFEKLENLTNFEQPTKYIVKSTKYNEEYAIPVLTAGQSFILGYTNEQNGIYNASKEKPVIIFDDFTGAFKWVDFPFKVKSSAIKIITAKNNKTTIRYLYHMMGFLKFYSNEHKRLWISAYSQFKVAVPPLEVQCKIVHILDDFTLLSAELSAELKARQKQFSYYRECLINNGGHKIRLDKIVDIYLGLTHTPKYVTSGIKFISAQNTSKDYLDLTNVKYISREEYESITQNAKPKKGDILFTRVGSNLGHPVIVDTDEELCMFVSLGYVRVKDTSKVSNDYIKHWINTENFWNQVRKNVHGSAKVNLNTGWLSKFEISIPNFDEQKKIVNILNVLEKLCNDISEGLPAEIEARQRQYEYYRDKLLTFKELKVNE